jgi:hypothetical protein
MRSLLGAIFLGLLICSGAAEAQAPHQMPPSSLKCAGDKVVWVNTSTHVYHFQGDHYFGGTKHGKFMCEHDAHAAGYRSAKNAH